MDADSEYSVVVVLITIAKRNLEPLEIFEFLMTRDLVLDLESLISSSTSAEKYDDWLRDTSEYLSLQNFHLAFCGCKYQPLISVGLK